MLQTYTGNAMLNNALMTIEALAGLKRVSDITPSVILKLSEKHDLKSLNTRLKSYTMLFTKNGPLHNDAKNGLRVYDVLMRELLTNVEFEGDKVCEISGLKFSITFENKFITSLKSIGLTDKEIQKKDTTLNRNWFPLIGGLGSDAQALPQARFTLQIHPLCIAIMQFLPLSALLYKGGVLLIDSSNFEFSRQFVAQNVREIQKRIQATSSEKSIENVRDFTKGNYLLQAMKILDDKELVDDVNSDLNLWSFSNSGTGASCEIDRIPNSLLKKLLTFRNDAKTRPELEYILSNRSISDSFLQCLENNTDWFGLYPSVGKKKEKYEGAAVPFLETYFKVTNSPQKIVYAKYLAYLINKYKTPSFEKYLSKTDAWNEREYKTDLYTVLVEATKNSEWDLFHHCEIIDNPDELAAKNFFYNIHRITHYYYQKKAFDSLMPELISGESKILNACQWIISLIEQDEKKESYFIKNFIHNQNYISINYNELLIRSTKYPSVTLEKILTIFFDSQLKISWYSLNELLRIFYNQKNITSFDFSDVNFDSIWSNDVIFLKWKKHLTEFIECYQAYYLDKYTNKQTGKKAFGKLLSQINDIPNESGPFTYWLTEAVNNVNHFLNDKDNFSNKRFEFDDLLYNPLGEISVSFMRFIIKFLMFKQYYFATIKQSETITI